MLIELNKYLHKLREFFFTPKFLKYFVAGFTAFLVDSTVLSLFYYVLDVQQTITIKVDLVVQFNVYLTVANLISVAVAMMVSYFINNQWTFKRDQAGMWDAWGRYGVVFIISFIVNNLLFGYLVEVAMWWLLLAKVVVTGLQMLWNFVLYRLVVFRD